MAGKGSRPRRIKDKNKFDANWDAIFNKNKNNKSTKGEKK